MTFSNEINECVAQIKYLCAQKKIIIVTAESCTGGLIAGALTSIAGSSAFFERGFVTYTNTSKTDMLNVPFDLIDLKGAVSGEVAIAMAHGALQNSKAQLSIAVTGIAGPGGGTPYKPVGRVHVSVGANQRLEHRQFDFGDIGRDQVREKTVHEALKLTLEMLG